ncbi:alpha/beta hydrolase [Enemella evansiae]|uniref:alpha/beta hydrolase n=1 Tax=Enemella evansiae TaxID=2016499 RepID=UPI00117D3945|nr:alpha/beta fold hydrolase [Enemella evansiae]
MGLRSGGLAVLLVALTVLIPLLVLVRLDRSDAGGRRWAVHRWRLRGRERPRNLGWLGVRWVAILLAQTLAVFAVLVLANREMRFYMTWGDLLGTGEASNDLQPRQVGPPLAPDPARPEPPPTSTRPTPSGATLVRMLVRGQASGVNSEILMWLPPAYFSAGPDAEFPVLFMMSGSPGTPEGVYNQFEFDKVASESIASGDTKPFIAVFPTVMTHPPRDTECLDIPGGPKSETWLVTDVPAAVNAAVRASGDRRQWNLAGYSTGGLCATNLLLRHRDQFGAAASIGGYYHPWVQPSEGDLFGGSEEFRRSVTPLWQFQNATPQPTKLLIVTSARDKMSWDGNTYGDGDSKAMIEAARRWPGTAKIVLGTGGHGFKTYVPAFPQALAWLGRTNGL